MKLDWLHWLLIAGIITLGAALWLTPHRYERWLGGGLVRINRITGDTEILSRTGWRLMVETKKPTGGFTLDPDVNGK